MILNSKIPEDMSKEITEAYENLSSETTSKQTANDILEKKSDEIFVAARSSATTEDLGDASFAGQQDSFVDIKGNSNLLEAVKKVFASLFTSRATYYRNKKGLARMRNLQLLCKKWLIQKNRELFFQKTLHIKKTI